jgi:transposase-like protein
VHNKLREMKLSKAAAMVHQGIEETLEYMYFPDEHWRHIRTNNPLERVTREIRRRIRVVGSFPDGNSALMLVTARLRNIAGTKWGTRRYLNTDMLREKLTTEEVS